jgi:hypothetical protein
VRIVQHPVIRPQHCAVLPYIGSSSGSGFIDTGAELPGFDNHVYVSFEAVWEMARMLGWVPPTAMEEAQRLEAELRERIAELESEVGELSQIADTVELVQQRRS